MSGEPNFELDQRTAGAVAMGTALRGDHTAVAVVRHTGEWSESGDPKMTLVHLERAQIYDPDRIVARLNEITAALEEKGWERPTGVVELSPTSQPLAEEVVRGSGYRYGARIDMSEAEMQDVGWDLGESHYRFTGIAGGLLPLLVHFDAAVRADRVVIPQSLKNGPTLLREAERLRTRLTSTGRASVIAPDTLLGEFADLLWAAACVVCFADRFALERSHLDWCGAVESAVIDDLGEVSPPGDFW